MQNKRILIFSLSYLPLVGGAEIAIKEIAERVKGVDFDLVTLRFSKSHPAQEKIGNVNVYRIGGGLGYLSKILFVPQAALWARKKKYEGYWAMMTYMTFPISLLRLMGDKTPYILTLQDGDPFEKVFERLRIRIFSSLLKKGVRRAKVVQTISNFLASWAEALGYKGRVEVIPNGVNLSKFEFDNRDYSKSEIILIHTGRLVEKNGVADIIDALNYLPSKYKLKILGTGQLEQDLKHKVRMEKLGGSVEFLGFIANDELPKYLKEAHIFIRPSLSEGQGISFIEAMACGLPIIGTPVGGIPDFLKDRETGVMCTTHNPESIAKAVEEIVANESLREKIISAAHNMVKERYSWDLIASEMQSKVFEQI